MQLLFVPQHLTIPYSESQNIQNSALRITTCCVKMASIEHLNEEINMLPAHYQLPLISSQYFARALQPNIPFHSIVSHLLFGYQKHE